MNTKLQEKDKYTLDLQTLPRKFSSCTKTENVHIKTSSGYHPLNIESKFKRIDKMTLIYLSDL